MSLPPIHKDPGETAKETPWAASSMLIEWAPNIHRVSYYFGQVVGETVNEQVSK